MLVTYRSSIRLQFTSMGQNSAKRAVTSKQISVRVVRQKSAFAWHTPCFLRPFLLPQAVRFQAFWVPFLAVAVDWLQCFLIPAVCSELGYHSRLKLPAPSRLQDSYGRDPQADDVSLRVVAVAGDSQKLWHFCECGLNALHFTDVAGGTTCGWPACFLGSQLSESAFTQNLQEKLLSKSLAASQSCRALTEKNKIQKTFPCIASCGSYPVWYKCPSPRRKRTSRKPNCDLFLVVGLLRMGSARRSWRLEGKVRGCR